VARYEIVADQARFDVTLRPGLPDLRVRVHDVVGGFDAELFADGTLNLDRPVTGALDLRVSGLHTRNRLLAGGLEHLLGTSSETTAHVDLVGAHPHAPGTTAFDLSVTVAGRDGAMRSIVRIELHRDDEIEAMGHTRCDPRAFGAPLPPVVNLMVNVRWHLRLRPARA